MRSSILAAVVTYGYVAQAACPYMGNEAREAPASHGLDRRDESPASLPKSTADFLGQFEVNDTNTFLTSRSGVPIEDQDSLSAGERGPTLLEDFIFREKIMHFGTYRGEKRID